MKRTFTFIVYNINIKNITLNNIIFVFCYIIILNKIFKFEETFHDEGQIDMYAAMKAYYDIGFTGPIRPDHVPTMAGDSNENPCYSNIGSLFAFGYMRGLMQAISNGKRS